ncbi:MAG: Flp family type IVb pilin [Pseudomonadota bacterium]
MLKRFKAEVARFGRDESGASLLEYTILLAVITVGVIATISAVGTWVGTQWTTLNTTLTN